MPGHKSQKTQKDRTGREEAHDNNRFVAGAATVAALGGLLFGYGTAIVAGAILYIGSDFGLSPFERGAVVSAVLLGATVTAPVSGRIADRIGRRRSIILIATIYAASSILAAFSPGVGLLLASRFLTGLAVGAASFVVPLYIAEISPARIRGGLVSLNQLLLTVGIMISLLVAYLLSQQEAWRWMLGLGAVPGLILAVGMLFLPETPRWLMRAGRDEEARRVAAKIYGKGESIDLEEMRLEANERGGIRESFAAPNRRAMLVGIAIAVLVHLTGLNIVIYYAPSILANSGVTSSQSILGSVLVAATNVVVTVVAIVLVDRAGRRPLYLGGVVGMFASLLLLGFAYSAGLEGTPLPVVGLILFIASGAIGPAAVFWLLISEIFPLWVRGAAMSIATAAHWGTDFTVALTFPTLVERLGLGGTFWIYAVLTAAGFVFAIRYMPETMGRTLEEIEWDSGS